jgi:hypothetical protein
MTNLKHIRLSTLANQGDATAAFLAPSRTAIDWSPLIVSNPSGSCQSCGLSAVARHYKVPAIAGWFCSILCVECVLFGPHRCRWCGTTLDGKGARRFCNESCARRSAHVLFGDGTRLLLYLSRLHSFYLVGPSIMPRCAYCGAPLTDKRVDARFCSEACRKRTERSALRKGRNAGIIADGGSVETTTYNPAEPAVDQNRVSPAVIAYPGQYSRLRNDLRNDHGTVVSRGLAGAKR